MAENLVDQRADDYCECCRFPPGSRRRDICEGTANLPLDKINARRATWGMDPLPDDGRERPAFVVHRGNPPPRQHVAGSTPPSPAPCNTCGGSSGQSLSIDPTCGPGSELKSIWEAQGYPACQACMILAAKMNIWGNAGCRQRLAEIVDDILPRALAWIKENRPWVNALADIGQAVGAIDKTAHVRKRIEADVLAAIESSEAKPCQRKQAVSANRYEETISRDTVFDPRWKSDPAYLSLAENLLESTAIIVKSFQRHAALLRFVQSVREFYPRIPIHVADDSFENIRGTNSIADQVKQIPGVHWHAMPFDSGLPAGRNLAISQANTKYVVLCDDDFVFTAETDLSAILLPLVQCNIDLCGGLVRMDGENAQNWCGMLKFTSSPFGEKNIVMEPPSTPVENCGGIRLRRCHVTYNFFAAKRQMLLDYPYDEQFKISSEHLDSFMTWWQARKRIAFTIDCICSHSHEGAAEYKAKRNRRSFGDLLKKWGLAKRLTGGITKFPGV